VLSAYGSAIDIQVADATLPMLSRGRLELARDETRGAAPGADGSLGATRRYIQIRHEASACPPSAFVDGACEWRGSSLARSHVSVLAAGTLGRAVTESERAREAEGYGGFGRAYALWVLRLSAPVEAMNLALDADGFLAPPGGGMVTVRSQLEAIAASFDLLD